MPKTTKKTIKPADAIERIEAILAQVNRPVMYEEACDELADLVANRRDMLDAMVRWFITPSLQPIIRDFAEASRVGESKELLSSSEFCLARDTLRDQFILFAKHRTPSDRVAEVENPYMLRVLSLWCTALQMSDWTVGGHAFDSYDARKTKYSISSPRVQKAATAVIVKAFNDADW